MISGSPDGFTHEPGAMLQAARQAKNIDLEKVAAALHAPLNVIEAMETNRFEVFDAPVYAKGFLRKYATFLDLDPAIVIAAYDGRSGKPLEPTHIPVTPAAPRIRLRLPIRQRMPSLKSIAVVASAVAFLAGAYWYSGYRTEKLRSVVAAVKTDARPDSALTETVPQNGQSVTTVSPSIPVQTPAMDGAPAAVPVQAAVPEGSSEEITISGVRDAWVEVRGADGSRLFYDHVRVGELRSVRAPGPWRIYLSDADAIEIRLGAHIVDVPASRRSGAEARFGLKPNGAIL